MKRLFVAVDINLSNKFNALTQELQFDLRNDDIVWVKNNLQHLTLRFLGETPDEKIEPLVNIINAVAQSTQAFELQLDKLGIFGSKYAPETLWLGFSEFSLFKNLFEKLEKELQNIGFLENYGNFVPHITIGRIKKVDNKKNFWKTFENRQPQFTQLLPITHLKLLQSKLSHKGPKYKTLFEVVVSG